MNKVRLLAIMMRATFYVEALNNIGSIGNVTQSRELILPDGTVRQAISGDTLKHQHTKSLRLLADEDELCSSCKIFSPMKNGDIKKKDDKFSDSGNRVLNCIIDDCHGFFNGGKGRNEKRESCISFSWAIATEENECQEMVHSRVEPLSSQNKKTKNEKKKDNGENATISDGNSIKEQNTQMIFYKPIRSNTYAITIKIDLDRIGLDDENLTYVIDEETRIKRQKKIIQALRNMFIDMEGAMCSTRLPHIINIEGVVVDKKDVNDVLVKYSALNDDYKEKNKRIGTNVTEFNDIEEFVNVLDNLI